MTGSSTYWCITNSTIFNPYQSYVTDEIARQSGIMGNQLANQFNAGAFGGGREGVQQAELQGRTLSYG